MNAQKVICLTILVLSCFQYLNAQKFTNNYTVQFRQGDREWAPNLSEFITSTIDNSEIVDGVYFRYVQFLGIPNQTMISEMQSYGLELLEYIPHKTYLVSIPGSFDKSNFVQWNVRSVQSLRPSDKLHEKLGERPFPEHALRGDMIELVVNYFKSLNHQQVITLLQEQGFRVKNTKMNGDHVKIYAPLSDFSRLATLPFVRFVEIVDAPGKAESTEGTSMHRSNVINNSLPGGRRFDGTGIKIGIFDDGFVGPHIDFEGRSNQTDVAGDFLGSHGDMVAGIAAGAGNLDPTVVGMAPGAFVFVYDYGNSNESTDALGHHLSDSVMVFNSSYSNGCNDGYTTTTRTIDQQMFNNKNLLQVYSAGNSNNNNCGYGAGDQWGNITGGHKQAKNAIATANLERDVDIRPSSSRGPAYDGRIKPDISSHGHNQVSTDPNNTYAPGGGTSAAAPGIAGVSAQLYHAYRDLNAGAYPESGLIKACLLNGAEDLGNVGPDYIFGWGRVHASRSLEILEQNQYISASVAQGASNSHTITIPAGQSIGELRVMVYWMEPEASVQAAMSLVNDLDMELTSPTGSVTLPWLLDPTPNPVSLDNPAGNGVDNLNNVEQVVIDNPVAGTYTLNVTGSVVPFGSHDYYVVYSFTEDAVEVTYPLGGEGFVPGETEVIHWDAYGNTGNFTLEYSPDNGTSWNTMTTVSGSTRQYDWTVPSVVTGQALIRVSRGSQSDTNDVDFSIIELPQNIATSTVCGTELSLVWDAVNGADGYTIYRLGNQYMEVVGTSTTPSFTDLNVNTSMDQWYAVQATGPNNLIGRRSNAFLFESNPAGGANCYLSCTVDDDAGIRSFITPGMSYFDCNTGGGIPLEVELENLGPVNQSNFMVNYSVDNGTVVTENFTNVLSAFSTTNYAFSNQITGLSSGQHLISVWTSLTGDGTPCNDTLTLTFDFISGTSEAVPYLEEFESGVPPANWIIENPDNSNTWESRTAIGSDGSSTTCVYIDNFSYNAQGEEDFIRSYLIDLNGVTSPELYFDVAYAEYSSTLWDGMRVELSSDCGLTYTEIYNKEASVLATVPSQNSTFTPSAANHWREESVSLQPYVNSEILLRFIGVNGYGNNLYLDNVNVLDAALLPTASFTSDIQSTCPDGIVQFTDASSNSPVNWSWQVSPNTINYMGGTSAGSQNPQIQFLNPGNYSVTLIATNSTGSNQVTQSNYITIEVPQALNIVEDFNSGFPLNWLSGWSIENVTNLSSITSDAARLNLSGLSSGQSESVSTNLVDLSSAITPALVFEVAYAQDASSSNDALRVEISTDCQQSYTSTGYDLNGAQLATAGAQMAGWVPSSSGEWRRDTVLLTAFSGNAHIRFTGTSDGGQTSVYIDNINLVDLNNTSASPVLANRFKLTLYPNPTNGRVNVNARGLDVDASTIVKVLDVQGRIMNEIDESQSSEQLNLELNLSHLSKGVYFIQVINGEEIETQRLIIQ